MFEDRLTSREVAELLGISLSAVARLCARGTLAYAWFAGRRVFKKTAVEELAQNEEYKRRSRRPSFEQLLESGAIRRGMK
mgnify:CR=1 FL=1